MHLVASVSPSVHLSVCALTAEPSAAKSIRPVKINSMFYLSSREHSAKKSWKKTRAKKYTILFYFTFFLVFSFADFSLCPQITVPDISSPWREASSVKQTPSPTTCNSTRSFARSFHHVISPGHFTMYKRCVLYQLLDQEVFFLIFIEFMVGFLYVYQYFSYLSM